VAIPGTLREVWWVMRILCASDIHYHLAQFDWLLDRASDFDVVVLPGDHLQVQGQTPLEAQIVVVKKYLDRLAEQTVVLASSGNHDLDGPGEDGEQWASWLRSAGHDQLYVDGDSVDIHDVRFTVCPWWDGPKTNEAVAEQLQRAAIGHPARWVWVYHSPPAGTRLCNSGTRKFPDEDLARWIDRFQPDAVLCGHIHQAPWVEPRGWVDRLGATWVFNPGHQPGGEPPHVVIDLDDGTAEWFALGDYEALDLRGPP
jgi:Icc-related predicted phosphoesterase